MGEQKEAASANTGAFWLIYRRRSPEAKLAMAIWRSLGRMERKRRKGREMRSRRMLKKSWALGKNTCRRRKKRKRSDVKLKKIRLMLLSVTKRAFRMALT